MTSEQTTILIGALVIFLTAAANYLKARTNGKKVDDITDKVDEVHSLVNQQLTDAIARTDTALLRIEQLASTLQEAGKKVPPPPTAG